MFWGITPALDLLEQYEICNRLKTLPEEINILLIGGTDARHILKTLAQRYKHQNVKLNFFVAENCMESIARQLMLLTISFQMERSLGLDQKTKIFMELYGNTLIRPSTFKYFQNLSSNLIKMVTDAEYFYSKLPYVHLEVKYKERDYLETIIKFWNGSDEFKLPEIWDKRLRNRLGARYDSKVGVFDWDLHMRLHTIGAKQICDQEYKSFRLNGLAFNWLENEMSWTNRSLVTGVLANGEQFLHYGYLGDMETGPYISWGIDCEDKSFLKSVNGQNTFRATDVIERNLKQTFFELEHQCEYIHVKKNDFQLGHAVLKQEKVIVETKGMKVPNKVKPIEEGLKICDLSITVVSVDQLPLKTKYEEHFDMIYFGHNHIKWLENTFLVKTLKKECPKLVLVEHPLFIPSLRKQKLEDFVKEVDDKVGNLQVKKLDFSVEKDSYIKFI
ncbi:hypothetical protein ABEB36_007070 [Hypothenemus hampei]|uniref:Dynein assembly factor 3, axonemal n=1 Tax=Hypothenemus hampei TaxID=57062 RepID=A0ABD1EWM9_HYPHA